MPGGGALLPRCNVSWTTSLMDSYMLLMGPPAPFHPEPDRRPSRTLTAFTLNWERRAANLCCWRDRGRRCIAVNQITRMALIQGGNQRVFGRAEGGRTRDSAVLRLAQPR